MSEITLADRLEHLEDIGAADIRALASAGVFCVDDLAGCCADAGSLAVFARTTRIPEARLRGWLGRPLLHAVAPAAGAPDGRVVLSGANLGDAPDDGRLVLFQGRPAAIEEWGPDRVIVRMPGVSGRGMLFAIVGGEATNAIEWEACAPALVAEAIEVSPARPLAGEPVTLTARLRNDGTAATGVFDVRWEAGEAVMRPHGPLAPGEASRESTLVHTVTLPAGEHVVCFRAPGACAATVVRVAEPAELVIGVSDPLRPLDPATPGPAGAARMLDAFAVQERVPGVRLVLRARPDHAPTPRLDRIVILALAPDDLLAGLRTGALHAARLPYDPALERSLAADGRWTVTRVAAGLDVQSRAVCERDPEGAHAHLWYVRD